MLKKINSNVFLGHEGTLCPGYWSESSHLLQGCQKETFFIFSASVFKMWFDHFFHFIAITVFIGGKSWSSAQIHTDHTVSSVVSALGNCSGNTGSKDVLYSLWKLTLRFPPADWVEFSPYEIGMAKYGTFMTPDLFGSKFFMGTAVKKYEENPLHFLMGEEKRFSSTTLTTTVWPFTVSEASNRIFLLCQVCGAAPSPFCSTECWESKTQLVAAPWRRS